MTGHPQADIAKPSTVDLSSKEVVTLGEDPSPSPSHLPRPTTPCLCSAVLFKLAGHVDKVHDVVHVLGNQLIVLVPGGPEFDVKISKQYEDMPLWAIVPCSLNMCQRCQIGWWDVASHSIVTLASQHHHKSDNVWSMCLPFLNLINVVWFAKEGNPPLLDADGIGRKDIIIA